MTEIEFKCRNCGSTVRDDLLPIKHAVIGTLKMLNAEESCCSKPEYRDSSDYHRQIQGKSLRDLMPGLA